MVSLSSPIFGALRIFYSAIGSSQEKIIQMYNDGKDIPLIENILDIPRLKIEMILKQYKRENS